MELLVFYFQNTLGLEDPWLRVGGEASDKPIGNAVLSRMKQFRAMNKLKQMALKVSSFLCLKFTYIEDEVFSLIVSA